MAHHHVVRNIKTKGKLLYRTQLNINAVKYKHKKTYGEAGIAAWTCFVSKEEMHLNACNCNVCNNICYIYFLKEMQRCDCVLWWFLFITTNNAMLFIADNDNVIPSKAFLVRMQTGRYKVKYKRKLN